MCAQSKGRSTRQNKPATAYSVQAPEAAVAVKWSEPVADKPLLAQIEDSLEEALALAYEIETRTHTLSPPEISKGRPTLSRDGAGREILTRLAEVVDYLKNSREALVRFMG